jgi:hypothetical protein
LLGHENDLRIDVARSRHIILVEQSASAPPIWNLLSVLSHLSDASAPRPASLVGCRVDSGGTNLDFGTW